MLFCGVQWSAQSTDLDVLRVDGSGQRTLWLAVHGVTDSDFYLYAESAAPAQAGLQLTSPPASASASASSAAGSGGRRTSVALRVRALEPSSATLEWTPTLEGSVIFFYFIFLFLFSLSFCSQHLISSLLLWR